QSRTSERDRPADTDAPRTDDCNRCCQGCVRIADARVDCGISADSAPRPRYSSDESTTPPNGRRIEETATMRTTFPGESAEYRAARDRLLEQEIDLRRATEAVAAARRNLPPGGGVPEDYVR